MVQNLTFILKRRWLLLLVLPIAITAAVVLLAPTPATPETEFDSTAYVAATPGNASTIALEQAALDIVQPPVARVAAESLDRPTSDARDLLDLIDVRVDGEALTLRVIATSTDRDEPESVSRAFALAFAESVNGQAAEQRFAQVAQSQQVVDQADEELGDFNIANPAPLPGAAVDVNVESQRQALQDAVGSARTELTRLQALPPVEEPFRLVGVDPVERVAEPKLQLPANQAARGSMAFLLGLIGAVGAAAFLERFNPRIDDAKDAERIVGAPVLAQVPVVGRRQKGMLERASLTEFNGPYAEAFRGMRSHLDFLTAHEERKVEPRVMMVSAAPSEGKSTSSAFLALAYLETGRDVLIVGADLRRPTMHRLFGVPRVPGLSSRLLSGPDAPELSDLVVRDEETGALVVPSGPSTSRVTGLLHDLNTLGQVAQQAGRAVIVDSPPIVVANDAVDFLPCVDWVVMVVRAGRSSDRTVNNPIQQRQLNDAKINGCVVVRELEASDAKRYYYGYYDTTDTVAERLKQQPGSNGQQLRSPDKPPSRTTVPSGSDEVE